MKNFKRIVTMALAAVMAVSAMSVSAMAAGSGADAEINMSAYASTGSFATYNNKGLEVYESSSFRLPQPVVKVWVNNMSANRGRVYLVQLTQEEAYTGKDVLVENIEPNRDNQMQIIYMHNHFGDDYANYRYELRIEGVNNFPVNGKYAVRYSNNREELLSNTDIK